MYFESIHIQIQIPTFESRRFRFIESELALIRINFNQTIRDLQKVQNDEILKKNIT